MKRQELCFENGLRELTYELKKPTLSHEEFIRRLSEAEKYFFSMGINDPAAQIGKINAVLFLAKLRFLQEKLGYQPRAMVIGAADFSFQTSSAKFRYSVPEGAKLIWGDGSYEFIPAETEYDFCGMLVGGLEAAPGIDEVLDNLYDLSGRSLEIDGVPVETVEVFRPGNHFLNLYRVNDNYSMNLPGYISVLHSSANEFRKDLISFVDKRAERMSTPFGLSLVLCGEDADQYYSLCQQASLFALNKRRLLFEKLFDRGTTIINHNHYEMVGKNQAIIGCNQVRKEGEIVALMTAYDQPAYLVEAKKNPCIENMEGIFGNVDVDDWVYHELACSYLLPHGGGHQLLDGNGVEKVVIYPKGKVIISRSLNHCVRADLDFESASRTYRSQDILDRIQDLCLANRIATLDPIYSIKVDF